jgi:hypothetical protein
MHEKVTYVIKHAVYQNNTGELTHISLYLVTCNYAVRFKRGLWVGICTFLMVLGRSTTLTV